MRGGLHRRGPAGPGGAAADGLGPAGSRGQDARALAAGQGRGQARRRPGRARDRHDRYGVVDAAEDVDRRVRPAARWSPIRRRRSRTGSPLVHEEFGTNKVLRVVARRRRRRGGLRRGRRGRRAAHRQPPHRGRGDRAARRASPSSRAEQAHALTRDADPALPAALPLDAARHQRGQAPRGRARGRRRLRLEAPGLRRGDRSRVGRAQARAARQVDRDALARSMAATHHGRDQIDYVRSAPSATARVTGLPRQDHRRPAAPTTCCSRRSSRRWARS